MGIGDLRNLKKKLHNFKHHINDVISVKWNPFIMSMFASSSSDRRVDIWDLSNIGNNNNINNNTHNGKDKNKENNDLYESKIKSEQETITELKKQISSLSKKVTKIEKENINIKQPNNHNSSINININNNGNSSSKWIIKQENQEISNNKR